jgi:hypothetical protein
MGVVGQIIGPLTISSTKLILTPKRILIFKDTFNCTKETITFMQILITAQNATMFSETYLKEKSPWALS